MLMFGFLKKKLAEMVDSISGKVKDKSEPQTEQNINHIQDTQPEIEIEPAQQPPQRIETTVEIQSEEVEEGGEAEVIEIDFDERAPEKAEEIVKEAETEAGLKNSGFVEVEDIFEKPEAEPTKEYVTEEPTIEQRHAAPEIEEVIIPRSPEPKRVETEIFKNIEPKQEASDGKKSFFQKLTEKVVKKVTEKKLSKDEVVPMLVDLESALIEADVAVEVADKIGDDLIAALVDTEIKRGKEKDVILGAFRKSLLDILDVPKMDFGSAVKEKKPVLVAFWGFNGAGKTTSLAKTASWLKSKGYTCCFAAADTFRAGAEEQLEIHANNIGVKIVKHKYGADPAAVIFDAMEHAKAKGLDFVLADTAGRAHTNASLMEQMKKIVRVNKPDIKILVIDSMTGNDAIEQARSYGEIGVDAVIFTKVDVNEKGGAILSVTHELKKPIVFLGMGQEYKDFQEFDAEKFVDAVLSGD
jgi:fused signal recognition particle receptor